MEDSTVINEPTDQPFQNRARFSSWLLKGGAEPDPRFTLANERTFLAWIRTSLALLAGGVAVEAFMSGLFAPELRKTLSIVLLTMALLISAGSLFRWLNVERAMRRKAPLPLPLITPFLALGGAGVAAGMITFAAIR
ncbi:YidH family protein [Paenarthrobacter sp. 2TAF44]|uniref:YidH family protein n=1 Tax=Paenarthrobacter sp. 2TAF44 TaxID=3233018 RepID=UPI003F9C5F72